MSRRPRIPYPQPNDPLASFPTLCIDLIFSYFSPVELIGIERVHPRWRDEVNWRFNRTTQWKRWFPPLGTEDTQEYANPAETALAFRRVGRGFRRFPIWLVRELINDSIPPRNAYTRRTHRHPEIHRCQSRLDCVWGLLRLG